MLMTFEKYMNNQDYELLKEFENIATNPSVFDLIYLLPLSGKSTVIEEPFSLDDCLI